jgi:hypothetical protein
MMSIKPTVNGIRHMFATMVINATDLERTSDALRHSSLASTELNSPKLQGKNSALKKDLLHKTKDRSAGTLRSKITG